MYERQKRLWALALELSRLNSGSGETLRQNRAERSRVSANFREECSLARAAGFSPNDLLKRPNREGWLCQIPD